MPDQTRLRSLGERKTQIEKLLGKSGCAELLSICKTINSVTTKEDNKPEKKYHTIEEIESFISLKPIDDFVDFLETEKSPENHKQTLAHDDGHLVGNFVAPVFMEELSNIKANLETHNIKFLAEDEGLSFKPESTPYISQEKLLFKDGPAMGG